MTSSRFRRSWRAVVPAVAVLAVFGAPPASAQTDGDKPTAEHLWQDYPLDERPSGENATTADPGQAVPADPDAGVPAPTGAGSADAGGTAGSAPADAGGAAAPADDGGGAPWAVLAAIVAALLAAGVVVWRRGDTAPQAVSRRLRPGRAAGATALIPAAEPEPAHVAAPEPPAEAAAEPEPPAEAAAEPEPPEVVVVEPERQAAEAAAEPEPAEVVAAEPEPEPEQDATAEPEPAEVAAAEPEPEPEPVEVTSDSDPVEVAEPEPEVSVAAIAGTGGDLPRDAPRPPDVTRAWTAHITWEQAGGTSQFVALADGGAERVAVVARSREVPWPPVGADGPEALTAAVRDLQATLTAAGWRALPHEDDAAWYASRFEWAPRGAASEDAGGHDGPPSRRFRRVPWPADSATLPRCEIRWRAGVVRSGFEALRYDPGDRRGTAIGTAGRFEWLFLADPDPRDAEHVAAAEKLAQALLAAGWERAGEGASWFAHRFVWRREGNPPAEVEVEMTTDEAGARR